MLIQLYQDMCTNLEDYRAASLLTAIDYSKAFNRMSYQHCLSSLAGLGATTEILRIIASFLTGRVMTVKVGQERSSRREVTGGCPQGSILGVFLFNATINDLEDNYIAPQAAPNVESSPEDAAGPGMAASTPTSAGRPTVGGSTSDEDIEEVSGSDMAGSDSFDFLPEVREAKRRLLYHSSDDEEIPHESNTVTQMKWRVTPISLLKYVDDNVSCEKINMDSADRLVVDGKEHRDKQAVQSQNLFRTVLRAANFKGMKVNHDKTKLIVVSDSLSYVPRAHFYDSTGDRLASIPGDDSFKCLGFHISSKPSMWSHVEAMRKRFRQRYWVLRHLRGLGFSQEDLVRVYKCVILPIADYCSVVYHSQLTDEQDEIIERMQSQALKCIYGPRISAAKMRSLSGLTTLRARRIEQSDKFAEKSAKSPRFQHWFPKRDGRPTRSGTADSYLETYARCDRLYNSPIFYMRRRLNGKPGKSYGLRNRCYREDNIT